MDYFILFSFGLINDFLSYYPFLVSLLEFMSSGDTGKIRVLDAEVVKRIAAGEVKNWC